jgi:uncharacterized RDD family membrane protein YckC
LNLKNTETVEPTEIIFETTTQEKQKFVDLPSPMSRFLARMVDYSIFGLLWHYLFQFKVFSWFSLPLLAWIPIETLCISLFGCTPGKWILKISVCDLKGKKLPLKMAFERTLFVWIQGMGLGINILYFLTMLTSFFRLKQFGLTPWDRDTKTLVKQQLMKPLNLWVALIIAIFGLIGTWIL